MKHTPAIDETSGTLTNYKSYFIQSLGNTDVPATDLDADNIGTF